MFLLFFDIKCARVFAAVKQVHSNLLYEMNYVFNVVVFWCIFIYKQVLNIPGYTSVIRFGHSPDAVFMLEDMDEGR